MFFAPLKCLNMFFYKKIFEWNIPPLKWAVNTCSDVQSDPSWSDVLSVQCQQSTTDENKFKIQNYWTKQYINRNNQWSFFCRDFWFGFFQGLTLDVFHYHKIRKLLDLVFMSICRTSKKKEGYFTADQLFRRDQELPFSIY